MRRIGIIVAMPIERSTLIDESKSFDPSSLNVMVSGIGKVNSALCTLEMIRSFNPDCIINTGVSGSVNADVKIGDIVIGERTAYHDVWCGEGVEMGAIKGMPRFFEADACLLHYAWQAADSYSGRVHCGLAVTGDQFYISSIEDRRILNMYPDALSCDMESAAIAQTCFKYNVPFISIRAISDVHTSDEVQRSSYHAFWKESAAGRFQYLQDFISLVYAQ